MNATRVIEDGRLPLKAVRWLRVARELLAAEPITANFVKLALQAVTLAEKELLAARTE